VKETNIIYDEQTIEDIQQDIYQEENKYRQENQLDIVNKDSNTDSDIMSFNFNEEDYSNNNLNAE
ncbi:15746_t:CDS:1, partial [Funneliformis geosporum]